MYELIDGKVTFTYIETSIINRFKSDCSCNIPIDFPYITQFKILEYYFKSNHQVHGLIKCPNCKYTDYYFGFKLGCPSCKVGMKIGPKIILIWKE